MEPRTFQAWSLAVFHPPRLAVVLLLALGVLAPGLARAAAAPTPNVPEAEQSSFDAANRYLAEQSLARACDSFKEFLRKFPSSALASEAKVKGARACWLAGKDGSAAQQTLRAAGDSSGAVDLPRAFANATLAERGDTWMSNGRSNRGAVALEQLEAVARGSGGRWAKEARAIFFRLALQQMEQQLYNLKGLEAICDRVLSLEPSANDRARALLLRARAWYQTGEKERVARADRELLDLGQGKTEFADDALFQLAQRKESSQEFPAALDLYAPNPIALQRHHEQRV